MDEIEFHALPRTHHAVKNWWISISSIDDYLAYCDIYDETLAKFRIVDSGEDLYFKTPEDRLEFILIYG
jgi:hypothetical protein